MRCRGTGRQSVGFLRTGVALLALLLAGCPTDSGDPNDSANGNGNTGGSDNAQVTAELGYIDDDGLYAPIADGGTMPLFTALQGGSHIFATLRVTGFPPGSDGRARIQLSELIRVVESDEVVHDFSQPVQFLPVDGDTFQLASRFMFLDALPGDVDGRIVQVVFTMTDADDPVLTVTIDQTLLLELQ